MSIHTVFVNSTNTSTNIDKYCCLANSRIFYQCAQIVGQSQVNRTNAMGVQHMASALLLLRGPVGILRVQDSRSNFVGLQTWLDGHTGKKSWQHLHQLGWWGAQDRWSRGPQGPPGSPPPPWLRWPTVALDRRAGFEAEEEKVPHAPTSHPLNPPDTPTSREWTHPSGPRDTACHKPTWCDIITTFRPPLNSDYKMEPKSKVRGTAGHSWPLVATDHRPAQKNKGLIEMTTKGLWTSSFSSFEMLSPLE